MPEGRRLRTAAIWVAVAGAVAAVTLAVVVHNRTATNAPLASKAAYEGRLQNAEIEVLANPEAAAAGLAAQLRRMGIEVRLGHNEGNPTLAADIPREKNKAVNAVIYPYTVPPNSSLALEYRKTASGK
jgi:hypothetical protein